MQRTIDTPQAALTAGLVLAAVMLLGWILFAGADGFSLTLLLVRLVHVLAAMIWIGLVFFVNFVQLVCWFWRAICCRRSPTTATSTCRPPAPCSCGSA